MRFGLLKEHVGGRQIHENEEWKWLFVNGYTCYAVALTVMHQDLNGYSPPMCTTFFSLGIQILARGLQKSVHITVTKQD